MLTSRTLRWTLVLFLFANASPARAQNAARNASTARVRCAGEAPSTRQLFAGTVGNFKQLPNRTSAGILALGGLASLGAHAVDGGVGTALSGETSLNSTFRPGASIGLTPLQMGAAFAAYGIGRALNNPCVARIGADLFQAQVMAEALTIGIKQAVRRSRPSGTGFSFPSGHTTVTFASATVLHREFGWKVGLPAYAVASYVAASRVQMKRHYLSDVAFGAALGIVAGRTITIGRAREWTLGPMVTPEGAGIGFTWTDRQ